VEIFGGPAKLSAKRIAYVPQAEHVDAQAAVQRIGHPARAARQRDARLEALEDVVVKASTQGTPVLLRDVATIAIGPQIRRGVPDLDGEGDAVGGIVIMRHGENARNVIALLQHLAPAGELALDFDDEITAGTCVARPPAEVAA
jgi:multidrug efflux pump subunit AcrB